MLLMRSRTSCSSASRGRNSKETAAGERGLLGTDASGRDRPIRTASRAVLPDRDPSDALCDRDLPPTTSAVRRSHSVERRRILVPVRRQGGPPPVCYRPHSDRSSGNRGLQENTEHGKEILSRCRSGAVGSPGPTTCQGPAGETRDPWGASPSNDSIARLLFSGLRKSQVCVRSL